MCQKCYNCLNNEREMLMNALRALVNNQFKKSFYRERKKKTINILTTFFIFHKSCVKTFLKWIIVPVCFNVFNPKSSF